MAETVQQLIDDVMDAEFDATPAQVLRWLNRRHRKMVARSKCFRKSESIGPTVANQQAYALPDDLVELLEVSINGVVYGKGRHSDLSQGAQGFLVLSDSIGGVVTPEESVDGALKVAIYPLPTDAGLTIVARGAFLPPDLDVDDDTTLKVPGDFADALVAGAIATGLRRIDNSPALAGPFDAEFDAACEELRRQVQRRYRGSGAARIRVIGINA